MASLADAPGGSEDPLAALTASLASDFVVSRVPNDPHQPHPRFSRFKSRGQADAAQDKRRQSWLKNQRNRREDVFNFARQLVQGPLDQDESTEAEPDEVLATDMDTTGPAPPRLKRTYRDQLMLSEWLVDVPADLDQAWLYVLAPEGRRNFVVAGHGRTTAYARNGARIAQFPSALPGGHRRQRSGERAITLLDCLFSPRHRCYYILDLMMWNGHPFYDCDTEFRFFWLEQKLAESPDLNQTADINPLPFHSLPRGPCTTGTWGDVLSQPMTFRDPLDGILFYHKQLHYTPGHTPLVGWLKPYMLPEMLGVAVSDDLLALAPPDYVDSQTYMQDFNSGHYSAQARPAAMDSAPSARDAPPPSAQP
eukprot:snap_masked-scaffold186_size273091-processed-gene-1.9 protein:Tk00911 transcript:snap_masked-scaffold186_size273091-processed-gene-1.9-mRNA-1 annotation:"PREDICTED: snurportin-1"